MKRRKSIKEKGTDSDAGSNIEKLHRNLWENKEEKHEALQNDNFIQF